MKVTMKTHEQLLASGWILDGNGEYIRNEKDDHVVRLMFDMLGKEVEIDTSCLTADGWTITPAMVVSKEEKVLEILRTWKDSR